MDMIAHITSMEFPVWLLAFLSGFVAGGVVMYAWGWSAKR